MAMRRVHLDDVSVLLRGGVGLDEVARRLGVTEESIKRAVQRSGDKWPGLLALVNRERERLYTQRQAARIVSSRRDPLPVAVPR